MTITAAPTVPNPNSATFAADAYPFTQWMAALGPEIDAETARINSIGFGAYSATSATSLTVGIGSKSLTIEAGKSFAVGQPVVIASTGSPTNYMTGQVTSYNSGTGALVVNATAIGGSGTVAAWTISIASIVAGGGVSPDSIVVLTSGTSWTCPAGVTKAIITVVGGCGGGGGTETTNQYKGGAGGGGGGVKSIITLVPTSSYTYAIGAGGTVGTNHATTPTAGGAGGVTTWSALTANGGGGGAGGAAISAGGTAGTASGGEINLTGGLGENSSSAVTARASGLSGFGLSKGGASAVAGDAGKIVLELYK